MEMLMQYMWEHRLWGARELATNDGRRVRVIDPGRRNTDAGPDFFNAKVEIDGCLWAGNVEIHYRASDWHRHGHDDDPAYDTVVLHVVAKDDAPVVRANGERIPQMVMECTAEIADRYAALVNSTVELPCRQVIREMTSLDVAEWVQSLIFERLADKSRRVKGLLDRFHGSWEDTCYVTLARTIGFGTNSDAFEQWATALPLMQVAHHRDHPMQVEAMFLGTAGLLDVETMPQRQREAALSDAYFTALRREYAYLAHKFSLTAMPRTAWRFMRLRPQNSPYIRLSQLATLYCSRRADLSRVASCATLDEVGGALATEVGDYWRTHYSFGNESKANAKRLSAASVQLLVVNAVVPMLYAYGRHRQDETLIQRAATLMEELPPEDNTYIRLWKECGVKAENAADTQALIQLHRRYCERKECLRCRFGYYLLKGGSGSI